jgi:hypothetical protein
MNLLLPLWLRIGSGHNFRLWLPLWLLWPVWLLVLFLFLVTASIATLATGSFALASALAATRELHHLAAALRGAGCELQVGRKQIALSFI